MRKALQQVTEEEFNKTLGERKLKINHITGKEDFYNMIVEYRDNDDVFIGHEVFIHNGKTVLYYLK